MVNHTTYLKSRNSGRQLYAQAQSLACSIADTLHKLPHDRGAGVLQDFACQLQALHPQINKALRSHDAHRQFEQNTGHLTLPQRKQVARDIQVFRDFRLAAKTLPLVIKALNAQINFEPRPLYLPPPVAYASEFQHMAALDTVFMALHQLANPAAQSKDAQELGCHLDIPLSPAVFVEDMHAAFRVWLLQRQSRPARFLDIGCGGGVKLLLAEQFFGQVAGLEYDAGYVNSARDVQRKLAHSDIRILHADALEFDHYGEYDVLYFYRPMQGAAQLAQLEKRITSQARKGCILVAPYPDFADIAPELGCAHIAGHIYLAGMTQGGGDILRARAEQMGVVPPRQPVRKRPVAALWQPIIKATRANGFRVF